MIGHFGEFFLSLFLVLFLSFSLSLSVSPHPPTHLFSIYFFISSFIYFIFRFYLDCSHFFRLLDPFFAKISTPNRNRGKGGKNGESSGKEKKESQNIYSSCLEIVKQPVNSFFVFKKGVNGSANASF